MILNGNLELNALGLSVIKNAILDRLDAVPTFDAAEAGRIVYNRTTGKYHYNNGANWQILATASEMNAVGLELDNVETALGNMINGTTGAFNSAAFNTFNKVLSPSSVLDALSQLDASIQGHDQFSELEDVTFTDLADAQFTKFDAAARGGLGDWVNHTLVLADASDVTTTATELNQLHLAGLVATDFVKLQAITATATEINQLTNSSVLTADLTKLHEITATATEINQLTTSGVLAADLTKLHDITATAIELNYSVGVTSLLQTQLDNKQPLDADLTWLAAQTPATDSSETITINSLDITHAGQNDIIVGTGGAEGSRWTLKRGSSARTALGLGNIAILDEANFIRSDVASSNVSRNVSWNAYKITNLAAGTEGTDAVNLNQLQALQAGLSWKTEVEAATTANIDLTGAFPSVLDDVVLDGTERLLVKNQTVASENGIYVISGEGMIRASDFDTAAEANYATVFVKAGTAWGNTQWSVNSEVVALDTDNVNWVQTNALAGVTTGVGLSKVGNTINVNLGAGIVELPSDEVGIDLYDPTSSAIILTSTGTDRTDTTNGKLHLLLDFNGNGKLTQSAAGLKVTTNTITEAELTASVAGDGLVGGNGTALAVVSATGTAATGGDDTAAWAGVGAVTVTADTVGVTLGATSTTAAPGNHTHKAAVVTFDNTATSLVGSPATVQAAIESIDGTLDDVYADLSNVKTATGVNATTGEFIAHTASTTSITAFKAAANMFDVDESLAAEIDLVKTNITNRITKTYYKYTATSGSVSHTVAHNTAQQFCNVTVIDVTDELSESFNSVVIPQSIKFDTANQLTVTFNVPVKCIIVVMGVEA